MRILFCIFLCLVAGPAAAKLEFCNRTNETVRVAIGYKGHAEWTSEGWWSLPAGECKTVKSDDLSGHYYYRAVGETLGWEKDRYFFCTGPSPFTIVGDEGCKARGFEREAFNALPREPDVTTFTMSLSGGGGNTPADVVQQNHGTVTVNGILSHCDVTDANVFCELHAGGTRYIASTDGITPYEWLEYFHELPVNTPATWIGTLRDHGTTSADIALSDYRLEGHDPFANVRFEMQGAWVSDDDSAYQLIVYGGMFEELYDGNPTDSSFMTFGNSCPGGVADGSTYVTLRSVQGDEPRCFLVEWVGGHEMSLWSVEAMNMLNFTADGM